jgi:hypothetical protein
MSITDELRKLQQLHQEGGLTDDEFAAAKAAVLSEGAQPSPRGEVVPPEFLDDIRRQNELQAVDREWTIEREQYMETGRNGGRYIPERGSSLVGGIIFTIFGVGWTVSAASMGAPVLFPVFGVLFVIFGIGLSVRSYVKAEQYEQAHQKYRRRRARLRDEDSA